jgi:hypothetical protein
MTLRFSAAGDRRSPCSEGRCALMRPWPAAGAAHASAPGCDPRRSPNPKRAKTGEVGLRRSMDAPDSRPPLPEAGLRSGMGGSV